MRLVLVATLVATSVFLASGAQADSQVGFGPSVGTLGIGPQISYALTPQKYDLRANLGLLNFNYNTSSGSVNYSGNLDLKNLGIFADYHPNASSFRVTAGLFYNDNTFSMTGQPNGNGFTFNGNTYTLAQTGSVTANVGFNKIAPYFGIGWGDNSTRRGLHFTSDLGFMYQGSPDVTLTASGAASNPALASDLAAARSRLQSHMDGFQFYPVIQVGMNYHF